MRLVPRIRGFLVLLLAVLASPLLRAADWPAIDPKDLAMTSFPELPGASALVLLHREEDDDTNNVHSTFMRIKILTEAGRYYADVEIPYGRRHFSIQQVTGRTVHPDGSITVFEGKPFDKVVVKSENVKVHVKAFTLPDVQVGSILDFHYNLRYEDHLAVPPEWVVQGELFERQESFKFIPTMHLLNLAHGRVGRGYAWTSFLPQGTQPKEVSRPRSALASDKEVSEWVELEMSNVPALVPEPFSPPTSSRRYRVNFYYMGGVANEQEFWKEEGSYWNKEVEGFLGHNNLVAATVTQITAPTDTPEQKLRKLYAHVSKLENQSFIPERGETEEKVLGLKRNEGADDVLRQHSGDHDELNRLFVAMARAARLPAFLIRVPDREQTFFDSAYLSPRQFDAEIAIVQVDGKEQFFDPGSKFCPYGLLDWRYSNTRGLRQSAGKGAEFGETPLNNYNQAMVQRMVKLKLNEQGSAEGTVTVGFFGLEAMIRRQAAGRTDVAGRKKELEDEVRGWLPANSDVSLTKVPQWENSEAPFAAEFKVSFPLAVSAGKRWLVTPHVLQWNQKAWFPSTQRVNPIYFNYPSREIDEVHLTLPQGMEAESLPPNGAVHTDYALYQTEQKQESPGSIMSRRDLAMAGLAFPVNMYKDVKGFYDQVKAGDDQQVILRVSAHAASN